MLGDTRSRGVWLDRPRPVELGGLRDLGSLPLQRVRQIEGVLGVEIDSTLSTATAGDATLMLLEQQAIELVRAFTQIADADARQRLLKAVEVAAKRDGAAV
ncbi:hypothetical protein [Methylobacterium crusticola]|uniref:hypothetical protein n=1 Tax=Methylobacterium crusticola TaxID=1697972 RepID=UPI000FFB44E8|nr:hypothetical protein [Methylobacterium crusticola]